MACGEGRAEERFAVLIGANAGWSNDKPLRYAETDAERMREVLVELGGFAPDRVVLLREPDTTAVRGELEKLARTLRGLGQDSLVLFYYSGHADERHLHLRGPALAYPEVHTLLQALPATVKVGVLDACRSGSILGAKGGRPTGRFEVKVVDELRVRGLVVLTSSGADELSQETKALAGSVFTHHLVSGLRGAADEDGGGEVSLVEAWKYAWMRTEADTAASAVPHRPAYLFELKGQGELVLTQQKREGARLVLPRGEGERYVVVDEHEVRLVAEGRTRAEGAVALGLAPGTYRVKRVEGEGMGVARVTVKGGQSVEAAGLRYEPQALAVGLLKGDPEQMDEEERREWRRGEALRLLAAGEAGMALRLFEELLAQRPGDVGAQRGRIRSLLRLAEVHRTEGDWRKQYEMLRTALAADPSLVEDPDFTSAYRRLGERELIERRDLKVHADVEQELLANPRLKRRWSLGVEVLGTRGPLAVVGSLLLRDVWLVHVAVDPLGLVLVGLPSLDLGGRRLFPIEGRLSGFAGAGIHLSLAPWPGLWDGDPLFQSRYFYRQTWGNALHLDVGVQYIFESGLALELGGGLILSHHAPSAPHVLDTPMLNLGLSWFL
jgi:hypothetical protein